MAPPHAPAQTPRRERGSAVLEAAAISALMASFLTGLLALGYVIGAKIWLQYQSEQALYCLARSAGSTECRRSLQREIQRQLPWGHLQRLSMARQNDEAWQVEVDWQWQGLVLRNHKALSIQGVLKNTALHW